jgi:hypothetical protein
MTYRVPFAFDRDSLGLSLLFKMPKREFFDRGGAQRLLGVVEKSEFNSPCSIPTAPNSSLRRDADRDCRPRPAATHLVQPFKPRRLPFKILQTSNIPVNDLRLRRIGHLACHVGMLRTAKSKRNTKRIYF